MIKVAKRGKGNKHGVVKYHYLKFLLDEEKNTSELLKYLKEESKLFSSKSTFNVHKRDLVNDEIINVKKGGGQSPDIHSINSTPIAFRGIYKIFSGNNDRETLLLSKYLNESINDKLIDYFTSELINFLIEKYSLLYTDPEKFEIEMETPGLAKAIFETEGMQEYQEQMKSFLESDEFQIDEEKKKEMIRLLSYILIPEYERDEIVQILKSSPSSIEYILVIGDISMKKIMMLIKSYMMSIIPIALEIKNKQQDGTIDFDKYMEIIKAHRRENDSPILLHLRSLAINDYFSHKAIPTDWIRNYADNQIIPNVIKKYIQNVEEKRK